VHPGAKQQSGVHVEVAAPGYVLVGSASGLVPEFVLPSVVQQPNPVVEKLQVRKVLAN